MSGWAVFVAGWESTPRCRLGYGGWSFCSCSAVTGRVCCCMCCSGFVCLSRSKRETGPALRPAQPLVRPSKREHLMKTSDLVFIGIKGSVVALDRATGQQVWATHLKGSDFVNVVMEEGAVLASCCGEIFCLDPLTGNALWHNPLKGFGTGLATIATEHNPGTGNGPVSAAKRRRDEQTAASAAVEIGRSTRLNSSHLGISYAV